jgi:beta-aspartyl-dipeptidase (metallo-type)
MLLLDQPATDPELFTVIRGADVYSPRHLGLRSVVITGEKIAWVGPDDELPCELRHLHSWSREIDASGCLLVPGLIDPHEHTIGAGGEQGYASRTPEVRAEELLACGVTTCIGCLGTDVSTRHLTSLLAKTHQLGEQGLSAYMLTGGFTVPPKTITGAIDDDLVIVDEVIGVGEVAISDSRACDPSLRELARLITQCHRGGSLTGKSGVTLFHVGDGKRRLQLLNDLLDQHDVAPSSLVADHVNRTPEHVQEAIQLARRGVRVCMDTVDGELPRWLRMYRAGGGALDKVSVCSDAQTAAGDIGNFFSGFLESVRGGFGLEEVLAVFTANTADAWQLRGKGRIAVGCDADLLFLDATSLHIERVLARGRERTCFAASGAQ